MAVAEERVVVVVGAGLAGLACARALVRAGRACVVLEASDGVGGRVRTDTLDGFRLDRGFQVLLTAYPECRAVLDYDALDLRAFLPGADVRVGGRTSRVADPLRAPRSALATALAPVGTPADKARVARLLLRVRRGSVAGLYRRPEATTAEYLGARGFSDGFVERFFRPFFGGGVLLDPTLSTSSRQFEFVFRMLSEGDVAVPAAGMGALPDQLAAGLPEGTVRLGTPVAAVAPGSVTLADGSAQGAAAVVVATEGPVATRLLGEAAVRPVGSRPVAGVYFAADAAPYPDPVVVVDGDGRGPATNVCALSNVSPAYAPAGAALVVASVPGADAVAPPGPSDDALVAAVRDQLRRWFGPGVDRWRHLRTYRIAHAQPAQPPGVLEPPERPVRAGPGLYVCGDHRDNASLQGALVSGRRAAEAVLAGPAPPPP